MAINWISSVKHLDGDTWLVNGITSVPKNPANPQARDVTEWIDAGNTPEAADPKPPPPTADEKLVEKLASDPFFDALLDLIPGTTRSSLENAIKAKLP